MAFRSWEISPQKDDRHAAKSISAKSINKLDKSIKQS
jgi:hypothetical protein